MACRVDWVVVGPFEENCYLYWDDRSTDGVIIDPGDEPESIVKAVQTCGFTPRGILLTHGHLDHIAAVRDLKEHFSVPLYIGRGEEAMLADPYQNGSAVFGEAVTAPKPDRLLDDEEQFQLGTLQLTVLRTPGHTQAGICYFDPMHGYLFCGDTLFQGSIGRTDLPGGSLPTLLDSIRRKILTLPDSVICFPGHGPSTTVGAERRGNPFLIQEYMA